MIPQNTSSKLLYFNPSQPQRLERSLKHLKLAQLQKIADCTENLTRHASLLTTPLKTLKTQQSYLQQSFHLRLNDVSESALVATSTLDVKETHEACQKILRRIWFAASCPGRRVLVVVAVVVLVVVVVVVVAVVVGVVVGVVVVVVVAVAGVAVLAVLLASLLFWVGVNVRT